ncbi:HMG-I/HMG-Y, DNA-binding, conserved site [Penicillium camemberti]|uniref:HMG-I/HMG-Y, DNA-binding, conserved site n=1 Tax=Penicillium camemberti (strain FM 013) TaxID=1429867 RepID=A0A0G4P7F3_PENC3|nr:HMG-I/HMG-Y, DNA-binding, conserved site [Penicillium camemberti]
MSNRNRNSDEALPELGSIEGQDIQTEGGGENNSRNVTNRRRRRNNRRRSGDNSPTIEQIESDAELEGQNNRRNNADNRHHRNNSHTSDDIPPGIERVGSDTEEQGDNVPFYEGDLSDENGEADFFLQPIWSTPELLDHTAETSGLPMEGSVLAWRGNGFGKSVIVGYACGGCATARLIPAARRPIPSRAPNISEQSLGRRRDYIRTERDIQGWGIVAWRVDKKSVDQDPISLLKPMDRAWYPETYVYIHWYGGEGSWESRLDLRFVHAGNELKTDMLIYNVAKEQEANYREALTGVRPEYPPANTHMINNHWRNVNAYRGAHWFQPRAEENRRMTTIGYEPVIPIEDNTQEFDNGIGISDSGIVQEASGEYQQGYYEDSIGGEEMDNVEGAEDVQNDREQGFGDMQQRQRDLSPIVEEGSVSGGGSFFTPNGSPSRVRWHGETQQRYGIFTPRATRSPSSGYIPQGNRDQGRRMPETPDNRRVTHLNRDNQRRTRQPNQGNQPDQGSGQRQTPQSNRSNRFNQPGNQQRTPQSNQSNQPDQGIGQRQTPQSNRSNRSNQPGNQQRTPQSNQGNQPDQGSQQRQTPQSNRSSRSNHIDHPSTESTGSSTAMPEGNRSLTQVRRGRGRPRRPDRTNIPNITATRRSARLNSVLGRP